MALTITLIRRSVTNDRKRTIADVTFDSSYPTGGHAVTASQFGLTNIDHIHPASARAADTLTARPCVYNPATGKLQLFGSNGAAPAALAEAANTSNQSTLTARVVVEGY